MNTESEADLLSAARRYLAARETHETAAREGLMRCLEQVAEVQAGGPVPEDRGWAEAEVLAEDGVALTVSCEEPDGTVRHRWRMPTSVALERAERALRAAAAAAPPGELRDAALDQIAEWSEPIPSYRPHIAAEVARSEARCERRRAVRERLRAAAEPVGERFTLLEPT